MSVEQIKTGIATGLATMAEATPALQREDEAARALRGRIGAVRIALNGLLADLQFIQHDIGEDVLGELNEATRIYRESGNGIIDALDGTEDGKLATVRYGFEGLVIDTTHAKGAAHKAMVEETEAAINGLAAVGVNLGRAERNIAYAAEVSRKVAIGQSELAGNLGTYADGL